MITGEGRQTNGARSGDPMTTIQVWGIPNCDTVKKARRWLEERAIPHTFHDFKKEGVDDRRITDWIAIAGMDRLVNRRGTTWRKLPDAAKADIAEENGAALLAEHSSMIRRPVVEYPGGLLVGFQEDEWTAALQ
jgi:Spx/MgsR family transcriptional regulator